MQKIITGELDLTFSRSFESNGSNMFQHLLNYMLLSHKAINCRNHKHDYLIY